MCISFHQLLLCTRVCLVVVNVTMNKQRMTEVTDEGCLYHNSIQTPKNDVRVTKALCLYVLQARKREMRRLDDDDEGDREVMGMTM